jgi:hypothetical protein
LSYPDLQYGDGRGSLFGNVLIARSPIRPYSKPEVYFREDLPEIFTGVLPLEKGSNVRVKLGLGGEPQRGLSAHFYFLTAALKSLGFEGKSIRHDGVTQKVTKVWTQSV